MPHRHQMTRWLLAASGIALASLSACQPPNASAPETNASSAPVAEGEIIRLNGAGASFPAPLYQRWFAEYNQENPKIQISYQSVGSGAGVQQYLAIGYVEYAYANENGLNMAALENQAGQYIAPTPEAAANALEGQPIPANFALEIPDPTSTQAYPIVGLTWLLLYNDYENTENAAALQNFVEWAFSEGDQYVKELGYVPLLDDLAQKVQVVVSRELSTAS